VVLIEKKATAFFSDLVIGLLTLAVLLLFYYGSPLFCDGMELGVHPVTG